MIDKAMRLLVLTGILGLAQANMQGAERLPPRALARLGDHRFYHGSGIISAVLSPDGRRIASADDHHRTIVVWDSASGERLRELSIPRSFVSRLAFSPDGKTLASGGEDNVVFLWDVTGAGTPDAKPERNVDFSSLWNDLASDDAKRAGLAIASMLRKPEAVSAFLREKLRPMAVLDEKRLSQLLADLDADDFDKREAASRGLLRLGERAEGALRLALANRPSLEMRRRIEDVLSKLEPGSPPAETLRTLRAIEVLEHSGTAEARRCLETLAKGAAEARPTLEAKAALQRLANKRQ
jgi:hypothetical protein